MTGLLINCAVCLTVCSIASILLVRSWRNEDRAREDLHRALEFSRRMDAERRNAQADLERALRQLPDRSRGPLQTEWQAYVDGTGPLPEASPPWKDDTERSQQSGEMLAALLLALALTATPSRKDGP